MLVTKLLSLDVSIITKYHKSNNKLKSSLFDRCYFTLEVLQKPSIYDVDSLQLSS